MSREPTVDDPPSAAPHGPTTPRGRAWHRWLWALLIAGTLALLAAFALIGSLHPAPIEVTVNGAPLVGNLDLAALPPAHRAALACVLALVLLLAALMSVLGVAFAAVVLVPVLLVTVALPVVVGGLVVLVVLSPLALLAWLLWRVATGGRRSTTIAA